MGKEMSTEGLVFDWARDILVDYDIAPGIAG